MGYAFIPIIFSVVLALVYIAATEASRWSKIVVAAIVALSLVIWRLAPQWLVVATLLQVAASVYVIAYFKVSGASTR